METYAGLLRDCADRLDRNFANDAATVIPDVQRVLAALSDASIDDGKAIMPCCEESAEQAPPPWLVLIENHPRFGVSAKYEIPPLKALPPDDFDKFVSTMYGIVLQVAVERSRGE